ncbi:tetratricopeptide repeat protein [Limisalsivibrio acetivorans]|uniref:tetratricopeptide repeat protein n=1 Tax=Limisalsivibrio acetivorans TaxID=1304888 RepID=UPI0003B406E6|nr:tetratricopeptide repeat protein [Limisalsivibrio acetivorans]
MRLFKTFLFIFLLSISARAEVLVPEFSFTGEEIAAFDIRPTFMDVSLNFNVSSSFDTYIKQERFKLNEGEGKDYETDEPGGIYSGGFGTGLSSVFVGPKAYRNNIVKAYLNGRHLAVVESWNKYQEKLVGSGYLQESKFIAALSGIETGNISSSLASLKEVALEGGEIGEIAADRLYSYYFGIKDYDSIIETGREYPVFTDYSLYTFLYSLMQKKEYNEIIETSQRHEALAEENPSLYDFKIMAHYSLGERGKVMSMADKATENTRPVIADTMLAEGRDAEAADIVTKIPEGETKAVLSAKLAILRGNNAEAVSYLDKVKSDENRLNIFFYYVSRNFPELDGSFAGNLDFDSKVNSDYVNFYVGLSRLAKGEPREAAEYLDMIIFNKNLINTAYYYRGLTYVRFDPSRAEFLFLKYIDNGEDEEKVRTSRFMLAQLYNLKGRQNDALVLIEDCFEPHCKLLKAEIFISRKQYSAADGLLTGLEGDQAHMLRGTVDYNRKQYEAALRELTSIQKPTEDSDYLLMLTYLKLGRNEEASAVFERNAESDRFYKTIVENLFLAGEYQQVLNLIGNKDRSSSRYMLLKAKTLSSLKRYDEAEKLYSELITRDYEMFDSVYGLLSIYAAQNEKDRFLETGSRILTLEQRFEKKDFLILQAARLAIDIGETGLATRLVNRFFSEFPESTYLGEGYLLRGRLFKETGRVEQCVNDAERLIERGESREDALFLKADCLEAKDKKESLRIYEELASDSMRFGDLAHSRILEISSSPASVLRSARYFMGKDEELYYRGIERYFSLLSDEQLVNNEGLVRDMVLSRNARIMPAAYFQLGRLLEEKENFKEGARFYMKSHYLFPDSDYSKRSLERTVDIYKKLGREKEASVLEKKLKSLR